MNNFISKILLAAAPIILASSAPAYSAKPAQDYTKGNALWFDTPNPSHRGVAIWNIDNGHAESANPDTIWERCSFPIGNGSFGGNVIGSVARERVVLNEKSLWKGGPAAGLKDYWNMNRQVPDSVLSKVRTLLEMGRNAEAGALVSENYRGNVPYTPDLFGTFTVLGEAYVTTGIPDDAVTDYRRILNLDNSLAVVEFNHKGSRYQRRYFTSYPDSVMVWRFTSSSAPQTLVFSFATPQELKATDAAKDGLLYTGTIDNNGMKWALRVMARTADPRGTVKADPAAGTITVTGSRDVEFILAADTDYRLNFNPDTTDPKTYTGGDPVRIVNSEIDAAAAMPYTKLYDRHLADYKALYDRVDLEINPGQTFPNLPTPQRLANYRNGVLDHDLERMHFQYGRYLLISSSRPGNLPAHLQGLWHNNVYGPWKMDYHNNINVQMNYWPATSTNLMECFEPYTDYIRSLVKPGEATARDYYGARGWTAAISANPFGFTAPLNSTDMSWNYNPSAGPWLATQIWEYYDYTRDRKWLREIGYPIIKASANFAADLLTLSDGEYTVSPSYSPEHGGCDRGTTYANAVTREILTDAIKAARILDTDPESVKEWEEKLARIKSESTASCRNGMRISTTRTTTIAIPTISSASIPDRPSTPSTILNLPKPARPLCASAATRQPDGAWAGNSTTGHACTTATMPTPCSRTCSKKAQPTISGTSIPRSRSTATSEEQPAWPNSFSRATPDRCSCSPPSPRHGPTATSTAYAHAETSRLISIMPEASLQKPS